MAVKIMQSGFISVINFYKLHVIQNKIELHKLSQKHPIQMCYSKRQKN
jgi:hypothetical protein